MAEPQRITVDSPDGSYEIFIEPGLRELIPAPAQKVTVRLPAGARVRKVQLLSGAQTPRIESTAGAITLTVPAILDLEVIAIDLV